jgi:hypothetical protein
MADGSQIRGDAPSWVPPSNPAPDPLSNIIGDQAEMKAILADYEGNIEAFMHDCVCSCDACGRRFYAGFGLAEAEFDDQLRFTCEDCEFRMFNLRAGSIYDSNPEGLGAFVGGRG